MGESYSCPSGGVIAGGCYLSRPYLVALGHSMIARSELDTSWQWVGMVGESPHKWLNAFLRMPFDYIKCDVDMPATNNMVNGFYGQGGDTSGAINTVAQAFIDAVTPLTGSRRVVAGLMCCENDLTGGTAAATVWTNYSNIINKFDTAGWDAILSTSVPTSSYTTAPKRDNVTAFSTAMNAALPDQRIIRALDWTTPYRDTGDANGYQVPLATYTLDGIHLTQKGAFKLALDTAPAMAGLYSPWSPAGAVVCSQNPTLTTLGGTLGSGASGVVPAGFTLSAPGASVVGSQVGDYYQLAFLYNGSAWADATLQGLIASAFSANAIAGTTIIQNICDVEIVECTNYIFQARNDLGGGTGEMPSLNAYGTDAWMDSIAGRRLVLHSEPHLYPATATRSTTSFGAHPVFGATHASLTVRLRWMGTKQA